jgi:hypothetical protein
VDAGTRDEAMRFTSQLNQLHKQIDEPGMKAFASSVY